MAAEHRGWEELHALLAGLSAEQILAPGYYAEGWSAKDLLAHIAGWIAEAGLVLEQIRAGAYDARAMDVEGLNARFLEANRTQPFSVVHLEAQAARWRLLHEVGAADEVSGAGAVWLRKAGPDHYAEHLPRLREWAARLGSTG